MRVWAVWCCAALSKVLILLLGAATERCPPRLQQWRSFPPKFSLSHLHLFVFSRVYFRMTGIYNVSVSFFC